MTRHCNGVLSPIEIGDPSGGRKVRAQITACLILTILATVDVQTIASADDLVKFDSAAYRVGQLQQRQARERGENLPEAVRFLPLSMSMDAVGSRQIPASAWRSASRPGAISPS